MHSPHLSAAARTLALSPCLPCLVTPIKAPGARTTDLRSSSSGVPCTIREQVSDCFRSFMCMKKVCVKIFFLPCIVQQCMRCEFCKDIPHCLVCFCLERSYLQQGLLWSLASATLFHAGASLFGALLTWRLYVSCTTSQAPQSWLCHKWWPKTMR